ncbi:cell division protein ZapA [Phaeocystidibacter luteus]|uniref:Cell division protein ZapA n=1 Tax=Phaeocystidibacter luteus TaxID=911197 RepID=A0A6N6RJY6_9FLAO|nr:cell division protein ZapA [Phaeocystidibacter luteus]KAB2814155.1 cell division protein ZapA [Phaeocystidibacter luteus]
MDQTLKIKVNIAQRVYPLTIRRDEEERVRKAVAAINEAVKRFEERYAVSDKQDVLAMCTLQFATQYLGLKRGEEGVIAPLEEALKGLEEQLDAALK